ncbi:hypothetical protein [Methylobacillus flagellatus]|uniref:hypothetical protein n=1 Tax=Methylobacillus flagellatus TaxID=405 RepID=UPI001484DB55|nr:hypothetical protein [Methylobacillus flagellatus]
MMRRYLWVLPAILLPLLVWQWTQRMAVEPAVTRVVSCPDLPLACALQDGLQLRFDKAPLTLQPFRLYLSGMPLKAGTASFAMQGMEMGLNRYRLLADGEAWWAEVNLPVCVQGRSDWQLQLDLETAAGMQRVLLSFQAGQP